jgi:hypothetical protein
MIAEVILFVRFRARVHEAIVKQVLNFTNVEN